MFYTKAHKGSSLSLEQDGSSGRDAGRSLIPVSCKPRVSVGWDILSRPSKGQAAAPVSNVATCLSYYRHHGATRAFLAGRTVAVKGMNICAPCYSSQRTGRRTRQQPSAKGNIMSSGARKTDRYVLKFVVVLIMSWMAGILAPSNQSLAATSPECKGVERPLKNLRLSDARKVLSALGEAQRELRRGGRKCGYLIAGFLLQNWGEKLPDFRQNKAAFANAIFKALESSRQELDQYNSGYTDYLEAAIRAGVEFADNDRFSLYTRELSAHLSSYRSGVGRPRQEYLKRQVFSKVYNYTDRPFDTPNPRQRCAALERLPLDQVPEVRRKLKKACRDVDELVSACPSSSIYRFEADQLEICNSQLARFTQQYPDSDQQPGGRISEIVRAIEDRQSEINEREDRIRKERQLREERRRMDLLATVSNRALGLGDRLEACRSLDLDFAAGGQDDIGPGSLCNMIETLLQVEKQLQGRFANSEGETVWIEPDFDGFAGVNDRVETGRDRTILGLLNACHAKKIDKFPKGGDGIIETRDFDDATAAVSGRMLRCSQWVTSVLMKGGGTWPISEPLAQSGPQQRLLAPEKGTDFRVFRFSDMKSSQLQPAFVEAAPNLARAIQVESRILLLAANHRFGQYRDYLILKCNKKEKKQAHLDIVRKWGIKRAGIEDYIRDIYTSFTRLLRPEVAERVRDGMDGLLKCPVPAQTASMEGRQGSSDLRGKTHIGAVGKDADMTFLAGAQCDRVGGHLDRRMCAILADLMNGALRSNNNNSENIRDLISLLSNAKIVRGQVDILDSLNQLKNDVAR